MPRAGLRDDVTLQPAPAGKLVEIIARLHRLIHVLQQSGRFSGDTEGQDGQHPHVVREQAERLTLFVKSKTAGKHERKQFLSPAVTQSAVVHTLMRLERNSWSGKVSVDTHEEARRRFENFHYLCEAQSK